MADPLSRIVMTANVHQKTKELKAEEKAEIILRNYSEYGHGGVNATYVLTFRKRKCKGMYSDIANILKRCSICTCHARGATNLQKIGFSLNSNSLDKIDIDLVGP